MATQEIGHEPVEENSERTKRPFPRRLGVGILLLATVLFSVGATIAARNSNDSPDRTLVEIAAVDTTIEFPEGTHADHGMVEPGGEYTHRFAVRNLGPGEFRYSDFDWGCKPCAHMNLTLEPDPLSIGESGYLVLTSEVGGFLKGAEVRTFAVRLASDINVKVFEFSVAQEAPWEPTIEVTVPELRFGDIWEKGNPKVMETKVRLDLPPNVESTPLTVESDTPSVTGVLETKLIGEKEIDSAPSKYALLNIKVDPQKLSLGHFSATVTVRADFGTSQLKVSGKIVEGLSIQPETVLIKKQDVGPAVGYVVLRNLSDKELILEETTSDTPGIACEDLSPSDSVLKRLRVSVAESDKLSAESRIDLKCTLGGKRYVIPLRVLSW